MGTLYRGIVFKSTLCAKNNEIPEMSDNWILEVKGQGVLTSVSGRSITTITACTHTVIVTQTR